MKKWFFILSVLLLTQSFSLALEQEKSFVFGDSVFQFEQPRSYYSDQVDPIVWRKLYFIKNGQKYELFKGEDVTFDLIEPDNISKNGSYFMITYLRYGYASGDKQFCALINSSIGCVIDNYSWSPICDGSWSDKDGEIWIYPDDSIGAQDFISWNLNDAIFKARNEDDKISTGGELNANLCRGEAIQNIVHDPFKTDLYPQGEIYFEQDNTGDVKLYFENTENNDYPLRLIAKNIENNYIQILATFETAGGNPQVKSFFTYPIKGEEHLFVLISWFVNSKGAGAYGDRYQIYAYKINQNGSLICPR